MSASSILARHIDKPDDRHRCVLLDATRIRCLDCAHTVELRPTTQPGQSTSTSTSPAPLHDPDRCTRHPGQRLDTCSPCRSEHLEAHRTHTHRPTADVAAGAAAARAALVTRRQETQ